MPRKLIISLILVVAFLGTGTGIAWYLVQSQPPPATSDAPRRPLLVNTQVIRTQTVTETLVGFGTARADRYARLSAQVAGEVVAIPDALRSGAPVKKGQVLIRIDDREYQRILNRAESQREANRAQLVQIDVEEKNIDRLLETVGRELASAEWDHTEVARLFKLGNAPQREFEQSRLALERTRRVRQQIQNRKDLVPSRRLQLDAALKNSQAEVELARLNVERSTIRAPFDGRVDQLLVEIGERVQPGIFLISLLDPDLIEVAIELPVSIRSRVKVGAACTMSLESQPKVCWQGQVNRISPRASETTRSFKVYIDLDNRDQAPRLMPGYFVRARIDGPTLENVILIPRGTIQQDHVFIYNDGRAHQRDIRIERFLEDQGVVTGLSPGDLVITSNLDALFEGVPVRRREAVEEIAGKTAATSNLTWRR